MRSFRDIFGTLLELKGTALKVNRILKFSAVGLDLQLIQFFFIDRTVPGIFNFKANTMSGITTLIPSVTLLISLLYGVSYIFKLISILFQLANMYAAKRLKAVISRALQWH